MLSSEKNFTGKLIAIHKKKGEHSNKLTQRLSRNFNIKVGHTGILDPMASGLLLFATGSYTKLIEYCNHDFKTYEFDIAWGESTNTDDETGEVIFKSNNRVSIDILESYIQKQIGEISQVPHKFSACKVNGMRSYKLVRQNNYFYELKPKKVTIKEFFITNHSNKTSSFVVTVSTGTYIRSIVRDMCRSLNLAGHAIKIHRIKLNNIKLENSLFFDDIINADFEAIKSLNPLSIINLKTIKIDNEYDYEKLKNGVKINIEAYSDFKKTKDNNDINKINTKMFLTNETNTSSIESKQDKQNKTKDSREILNNDHDAKIACIYNNKIIAICSKKENNFLKPIKVLHSNNN